jgi:RNA polymerase sigma-70 factor (ECF subfamily)
MQRDLVIDARAGDHDAFNALVAGSIDRLYAVARLILRDDDLARDGVQDALVRAWVGLAGLRDPDRFDAWLHRLLVNACYRAARHERSRRVVEIGSLPANTLAVGDAQYSVAVRDQLARGFARLSMNERVVVVLHYYLDLSDDVAAGVLAIPVGTLKSRLSRATQALRAALEADERADQRSRESIA